MQILLNYGKKKLMVVISYTQKKTDYFVKGALKISDTKIETIFFVRTLNDGWFSLGLWGGRLDIDGELLKILTTKKNTDER